MNRHKFTTKPKPSTRNPWTHPDKYLRPSDLLSAEVRPSEAEGKSVTVWRGLAMAAARLTLRGAAWSEDDRVECAGDIAAAVMGARSAARRGTPAEVLAWIAYAERFPVTARRMEDCIPAEYVTMTRLGNLAANWRRSTERTRDRDQRDLEARSARGGFTTNGATTETYAEGATAHGWTVRRAPGRRATPMGNAHGSARDVLAYMDAIETVRDTYRAWPVTWQKYLREDVRCPVVLGGPNAHAMDMLAALGLPRMGAAYPAALAAAWSATGLTGNDLAAVLKAPRKTAEKRVQRAAESVPSAKTHGYLAHADLLGLTAEMEGAHHAPQHDRAPRTSARGETCTCRATDDGPARPMECPEHPVALRRVRTRKQWDGKRSADWTRTLPMASRARMEAAAKIARAGTR